MANIDAYLDQIQSAVKGEEVRGSIINAIKAGNDEIQVNTSGVEAALTRVNAAAEYANNKGSIAAENASAAEVAANRANDISDDIQEKLSSGYFKGEQGDTGEKGDRGDSGVLATASGMFALYGDADGNLYADYNDNDAPPQFEVDSDGNIYYIVA